jgi:parallel beta-helix repeat protein
MQDLLLGAAGRYIPPSPSPPTKDLAASAAANTAETDASLSQELTRRKLFRRKKFFMHKPSLRMLGFILACLISLFSGFSANAATFYVASTGSNSNPGSSALPWATLQHAANVATAGDTVVVRPGVYAGAKFSRSGLSTAPITFAGRAGTIINRPGPLNTNNDNLWIRNAHYITLAGFESRSAPRSGIAVQGEPDAPATGIVLRDNFCHDNGRWGIFTGYAQNARIIRNETSFSGLEHGIYVSNSADNPLIRGNRAHHNRASGVQINADPDLPGDGVISGALIEDNVIYENGVGGGAAINLASVRNSTIRNNLLYNNHASGVAGWDNEAGNTWGTKNNKIFNNTIVMAANGRFAVVLIHGSSGNQVKNNMLIHTGARGSIETDTSSLVGLRSNYNIVNNRFSFNEQFITLAQWQQKAQDQQSLLFSSLTALFVAPASSDYHLKAGSVAINTGVTLPGVLDDLEGTPRPQGVSYDIGAYERSAP